MTSLTVIILTFNEEKHLARCLASVSSFATRVVVVDSYSTDQTREIARAHGADLFQNAFINHAQQFQWALNNVEITTQWVMRLDADEVVESDLAAEITKVVPTLTDEVVGINLKRKHIVFDRWIRYGGRYPLILLRIWRTGRGKVENRWMDEHIVVFGGRTVQLEGGFSDHNLGDLSYFIRKHDDYATREAIDVLNQRYGLFARDQDLSREGTSFQAAAKRWVKEGVYNRLPFWLGPLAYFLFRYVIQLGFLDGRPGLIYHFLQGFWYRFLVGAKVYEFERSLSSCRNNAARLDELQRLTGKALL